MHGNDKLINMLILSGVVAKISKGNNQSNSSFVNKFTSLSIDKLLDVVRADKDLRKTEKIDSNDYARQENHN